MRARYDHFQLMRGVACLMVLFNHVGGYLIQFVPNQVPSWWQPLLVPTGFQWVWLFLALSGFLLTKAFVTQRFTLDWPGIIAFYQNRGRRLLPLLWFSCALWLALFFGGLWSSQLPSYDWRREAGIALALPYLPYFRATHAIASANSPVWSAIIEIHYCVAMPFLLLVLGRSVKSLLGVIAIWAIGMVTLAWCALSLGWPQIFPGVYGSHLYNFGFFATGMVLALLPERASVKALPWPFVLVLTAAAMLGAQYLAFFDIEKALALAPFFVLPAVALLIARADERYQARLPSTASELWGGASPLRWLERIGMASYSIYLAHKPLAYIAVDSLGLAIFVKGYVSYALCTLSVALMLLVICACMFLGIENRFRRSRSTIGGTEVMKVS